MKSELTKSNETKSTNKKSNLKSKESTYLKLYMKNKNFTKMMFNCWLDLRHVLATDKEHTVHYTFEYVYYGS